MPCTGVGPACAVVRMRVPGVFKGPRSRYQIPIAGHWKVGPSHGGWASPGEQKGFLFKSPLAHQRVARREEEAGGRKTGPASIDSMCGPGPRSGVVVAFEGLGQHQVMRDQEDRANRCCKWDPPPRSSTRAVGPRGSSPEAASHQHVAFGK